jgi:GNAT superfamily N-acetyltransferase
VRTSGKLIAQIVLIGPVPLGDAIISSMITRNEVYFHHANEQDQIVIAKSMAVHPEWRGHDLSSIMLTNLLQMQQVRSADHLFAQMSVDNVRSWELFLKNGFGIVAAAIDPNDRKPRFILQRPSMGLRSIL